MKKLMPIFMLCFFFLAGSSSAIVINFDLQAWPGSSSVTYSGQGALPDPGNNHWNSGGNGWDSSGYSQDNLIASDGTPTGVGFAVTGCKNFNWQDIGNALLGDYQYIDNDGIGGTTINPATINFTGLAADTPYRLYLYAAGNAENKGSKFTSNGVVRQTTGTLSSDFIRGGNYVILDTISDATGTIIVTWELRDGASQAALNGFQITDEGVAGRGSAHSPVPSDQDDQVDPRTVTSVSWYSPLQDSTGAGGADLNIVSVGGYDVWLGTVEPNELTDTPTFTESQSLPVTLEHNTTYYWRVDSYVNWDSNDITGNLSDVIEGPVWQFITGSAYAAPEILTLTNVTTALELLPAELSASISSSDAITSVTFEVLDAAEATVTRTDTDPMNKNLTAELTTAVAGTYNVKLTVSDGTNSAESIAAVNVYETACEAQKNAPSGWTENYFDTNDDCVVDIVDLADMVNDWLDDTSMAASETYQGDVDYLAVDIKIECEDAYAPTDPNYTVDAPLEVNTGTPSIGFNFEAAGGQLINGFDTADFLTYEVLVPETGDYILFVRTFHEWNRELSFDLVTSVSPDGDPSNDTLTNLAVIDARSGAPGSSWYLYSAPVSLTQGTHLVRITNSAQWGIDLDFFGFAKILN